MYCFLKQAHSPTSPAISRLSQISHDACQGLTDSVIWEKDEPGQQEYITYKDLSSMVSRISNLLLRNGVTRGAVVSIYMPVSPLAVASMMACVRIGALHNVVFAGFSAEALAGR